jgi:anti-anti-sigma regulatory factor
MTTANLICESPAEKIRVARFLRPDVRPALYDAEAIGDTSLYKELRAGALDSLPAGGTLILNFGLIDWFPTAFYRILIQAVQDTRAKGCRVVVCCLPPNVKEGFELMGGPKLIEAHATEARAIAGATG